MPNYSIRDNSTQKESVVTMKYSELEEYFKNHPHIQQIFTHFPGTIDPVAAGIKKVDNGFREVLEKAKKSHWKSTVNTQ